MHPRTRHRRRRHVVSAALGTAAALTATLVAQQSYAGAATTTAENYGQYSLMNQRSAGQIWAQDDSSKAASQWAWQPVGDGESDIRWDDPAQWDQPATNIEHFVHDGDWVYLDGWEDKKNDVHYTQRVTSEQIGDGDCDNMQDIPSHNSQQHYVKWTIPTTAYCMLAVGTITNDKNDTVVNFRHRQIWNPAGDCDTKYHGTVRCIRQFERWADDNGHATKVTLERYNYLGEGLGMGLIIHQSQPSTWKADLKDTWAY